VYKRQSPHDALYFYWDDHLQAIRSGAWKLHFPHEYFKPEPVGGGGKPGKLARPKTALALFNLENDPSETKDLSAKHPDVVARLEALAARARVEFGDSATKQKGSGVREPGRVL
jgi:arylsulfatase A